jgi:hypothetical protein
MSDGGSQDLRRRLKERGKLLVRRAFESGQRLGFDVLPRHFYSQIPDFRELRTTDHWRRPRSLVGIEGTALEGQREFVRECCPPEIVQRLRGRDIHAEACHANGAAGYGPIEAAFLYCVIAARRPKRVVQVGAGVSTAIVLTAASEAGYDVELVCVDPYPTDYLLNEARQGHIELIDRPVQLVDPAILASLGPGGLLFIDSTHTVKVGSDVNYVVFEVLPRLGESQLVHFHDITLPYDYAPSILDKDLFFWNETALVAAFLVGNSRFRLLASLSMIHHGDPDALREVFPWYEPVVQAGGLSVGQGHFPSSAYIEAGPGTLEA